MNDKQRAEARKQLTAQEQALCIVLMFHKGGEWTPEMRTEWLAITGSEEATTKVMCDHIRKVLHG